MGVLVSNVKWDSFARDWLQSWQSCNMSILLKAKPATPIKYQIICSELWKQLAHALILDNREQRTGEITPSILPLLHRLALQYWLWKSPALAAEADRGPRASGRWMLRHLCTWALSPEAQWQHPVCNFLFTLKGAGLGIKKISGVRQFEMGSLLPSQLQVKVSVQIRQPPSHWESSSSWEEDPRHWCAIVESIKVSESFLRLEEYITDVFYFRVMLGYRWHSHLQASAQLSFQFAFTFIWLLYQRPPPLFQLDSPLYSQTALGHIKFLTWGVAESFPC